MQQKESFLTDSGFAFGRNCPTCQIVTIPDELSMFKESDSRVKRFWNFLQRARMASSEYTKTTRITFTDNKLYTEHKKHLLYPFLIHPYSNFRIWWDILMLIIFFLQFIVIPLELATMRKMELKHPSTAWGTFHLTLDVVCLIDFALNFITGYIDDDAKDIVLAPKKIFLRYIRSFCFVDILSSTSSYCHMYLPVTTHMIHVKLIKLLSLIKLSRIFTVNYRVVEFSEIFGVSYVKRNIILMGVCFMLYIHLITCINLFIKSNQLKRKRRKFLYGWRKGSRAKPSFLGIYLVYLYKALQIINNADFGIKPITSGIRLYIMFSWILSRIVIIFLIVNIMKLVVTQKSASLKFLEKIRQLKEYINHSHLSGKLQRRLKVFYEYRYRKTYVQETEILSSVSGKIQREVVLHMCKTLVKKVDFLKELPLFLLIKLTACLKCEIFLPNDVIFWANTSSYCMYFIASGSVAVYSAKGVEVCHLSDGDYFGEIGLLSDDSKCIASVVAVELCELYRLDRQDFNSVIQSYSFLVRKMESIARKRVGETASIDILYENKKY